MQITKCKIQHLSTLIFILVVGLLWILTCTDVATAGSYTDSAHGNSSYGINRTGTGYDVGDCANCHDSCDNEFMLFAPMNPTSQTDNFCFKCHKGTGSVQIGGVTNNDYGATFGGGTVTFDNIYDAFNPIGTYASSHSLQKVLDYAAGTTWDYTSNDNACIVCHDPHYAQKNHPVETNVKGGVNTAVRKPSDLRNLWGDEAGGSAGLEMFNEWTELYQAPYRYGKTTYEPAGDQTTNGSNLPNYVAVCAKTCHRWANVDGLRPLNWTWTQEPGKWPANPDQHGKKFDDTTSDWGILLAPYIDGNNYCLSCTDCHEPHGSPNPFLLRTSVNGKDGITVTLLYDGGEVIRMYLYDFCTACHDTSTHEGSMAGPNHDCYQGGSCHYHGNMF